MYDHIFYKRVQISRLDIRPHIKWAVSLVILHMVTSIFLQGLCGYIWVNILTLSPQRGLQESKEQSWSTCSQYYKYIKSREWGNRPLLTFHLLSCPINGQLSKVFNMAVRPYYLHCYLQQSFAIHTKPRVSLSMILAREGMNAILSNQTTSITSVPSQLWSAG